jgi:hypothetical protein
MLKVLFESQRPTEYTQKIIALNILSTLSYNMVTKTFCFENYFDFLSMFLDMSHLQQQFDKFLVWQKSAAHVCCSQEKYLSNGVKIIFL